MPGVDEAAVVAVPAIAKAAGGISLEGIGSGLGSIAGFAGNLGSIAGAAGGIGASLFGSNNKVKTAVSETRKGTATEQLKIDEAGIEKIIRDILGSEQGLASIFSEENVAGLFNTTVSAQASGNLVANLAGEIAKLTAKKVREEDTSTTGKTITKSKKKGLFG